MTDSDKIYLDQAATSYPKPEQVYQAVDNFARRIGIGGGRGNYVENRQVADLVADVREKIARLLNCPAEQVVLNSGTTESMNLLLKGCLEAGDHVIISALEHNCVLRPLRYLAQKRGIELDILEADLEKGFEVNELKDTLRPQTRLCVINHISNVFGTVQPVEEAAEIIAERDDLFFVLDGAQSLATYPLDVKKLGVDAVCFSGHKGTLGPTGTGGFYINEKMMPEVKPLIFGGTGRNGGTRIHSDELPHKYEVGTQNSWGIAGLEAGLDYLLDRGVDAISARIDRLTERAVAGLRKIEGVQIFQPDPARHHGVISFRLAGLPVVDSAMLLDKLFNIKLRAGLHCSPLAHKEISTYPEGTLRASFGVMNEMSEVDVFVSAVEQLVEESSQEF